MHRSLVNAVLVVSLAAGMPNAARPQGPPTGGPGAGAATVITKAVADLTNPALPQITIHGEGFGNTPQVLLGEDTGTLLPLFVQSATDTLVVADLPITIGPGSYMLIVQAGEAPTATGILDVTIGAVGPEGPQGPEGPEGPQGPPGASPWGVSGNDTFYDAGNVGIGTTSPSARLHVNDTLGVGQDLSTVDFPFIGPGLALQRNINFVAGTTAGGTVSNEIHNYDHGGNLTLVVEDSGGTPHELHMANSGNVGIGTTSPQATLHVNGGVRIAAESATTIPKSPLTIIADDGSPFNRYAEFINPDNIFTHYFTFMRDFLGDGSDQQALQTGSDLLLAVRSTKVMLLEESGNVGIGTTSPSERLHVVGNIFATGTITQGSSRELKENVSPLSAEEALSALAGLEPVKYNYKADEDAELQLGFIAEDVPELVATSDRKGVPPTDLIAVLARALQQQQEVIAALQERVRALEEGVD